MEQMDGGMHSLTSALIAHGVSGQLMARADSVCRSLFHPLMMRLPHKVITVCSAAKLQKVALGVNPRKVCFLSWELHKMLFNGM